MYFPISRFVLPCRNVQNIQVQIVRFGHQMSTKNRCHAPKPKHRGIKRYDGRHVEQGQVLVTQRIIRFHPGMNVKMNPFRALVATAPGTVRFTCEKFDPDFDNPLVMEAYPGRKEQFFKKYVNVVPDPLQNRFRLVDVV